MLAVARRRIAMLSRGMVLAALVLGLMGCNPAPRLSAEELVAALRATGCDVVERNRLHPGSQGADYGFVLDIDHRPVTAWRFESPGKAAIWATSNAGGFSVGYWAFVYADSVTAAKIHTGLGPH